MRAQRTQLAKQLAFARAVTGRMHLQKTTTGSLRSEVGGHTEDVDTLVYIYRKKKMLQPTRWGMRWMDGLLPKHLAEQRASHQQARGGSNADEKGKSLCVHAIGCCIYID